LLESRSFSTEQVWALSTAMGEVAARYLAADQKAAFYNEYAAFARSG
jgi:lipase chaperone LimK